ERAKSVARRAGFKAGDTALRTLASRIRGEGRGPVCRAGGGLSAEHPGVGRRPRGLRVAGKGAEKGGASAEGGGAHMPLRRAVGADEKYRGAAVQAFVTGQAHAIGLDPEVFVQAGLHLLWKLLDRDPAERAALHRAAEAWLAPPGQAKPAGDGARFLLWPFRV